MTPRSFISALLVVCACDGQQYVSPETVALVVTNDGTNVQRVNRCHYVPVLLGSEVKARYRVEDGLHVTITVTRDGPSLAFDDDGRDLGPFDELEPQLEYRSQSYTIALRPDCTPDDG